MPKKAWNQYLVVFALSMLVVVINMTTNPAAAEVGEVKKYQKISDGSGGGPTNLVASDNFGRSVARIGDLDDDGIEDLAVGASGDDVGGSSAGAVYVLFMKTDGTVKSNQKITEGIGDGPTLAASDWFGISVASIGDLDEDGVEDIAAGASGDNEGAVYMLFLNTNGTVKSYEKICQTNGVPILTADDRFGCSVASIGDLDKNGVEDIAVGAYGDDDGADQAGAVYVLFLNTNGAVKSYEKISQTNAVPELALNDYFGCSVARIGDLDIEDGVEDIAVGAYADDDGETDAGAVYVLYMNTNGTVKSYEKICQTNGVSELIASDFFGASVAGIGDFNGDGIQDIAAGATGDDDGGSAAGAVYLLMLEPLPAGTIFYSY